MTASSKIAWADRLTAVRQQWPSTDHGREQVLAAIADYDLLGRILRDVLRVGYEAPRRGQRSPLEFNDGQARLRSLAAERSGVATNLLFPEAFGRLADGHTIEGIADCTGIAPGDVENLLCGGCDPTDTELIDIAAAFGKPPTYFLEYRVQFICQAIAASLMSAPERTIDLLVRLGAHPDELDG